MSEVSASIDFERLTDFSRVAGKCIKKDSNLGRTPEQEALVKLGGEEVSFIVFRLGSRKLPRRLDKTESLSQSESWKKTFERSSAD